VTSSSTTTDSFGKAVLYLMFGVTCGLGLDLCAKWLLADYSLSEFVFLRSAFGLITFLAISRWYGGMSSLKTERWGWHLLRTTLACTTMFGFFYGIDLLFDADTIWSSAWVYAVLYLSYEGGPWNEYTVTEDFLIEGARGDDEYVVVTELQAGYPTGDYDILIELFDADTGVFLTDFGPESSSALSFLPLEDFNRDAPTFDRPVTVSRGSGGGAAGAWMLLLLGGVILSRTARRPGS